FSDSVDDRAFQIGFRQANAHGIDVSVDGDLVGARIVRCEWRGAFWQADYQKAAEDDQAAEGMLRQKPSLNRSAVDLLGYSPIEVRLAVEVPAGGLERLEVAQLLRTEIFPSVGYARQRRRQPAMSQPGADDNVREDRFSDAKGGHGTP